MARITRRRFIGAALHGAVAATLASRGIAAGALPFLAGVNIAGADFGSNVPGEHGTDYVFPSNADLNRIRALGFNVMRLPFLWERLQPEIFGPFDADAWGHIRRIVVHAKNIGFRVILDPHNYAHRKLSRDGYQTDHRIGSRRLPAEAFEHFWIELAKRTAGFPHIIHGLMNEPADISAEAWFEIAQRGVDAIRTQTRSHLILVPGTAYSGAHSWHVAGNTIMGGIKDPGANIAIEVHQYLDADSSGRTPEAVSATVGVERLQDFQSWARENGFHAFLGEFGSGSDPTSLAALRGMLAEVRDNRDVWLGWTGWAAGPWWPEDDAFALEPGPDGSLPPQMAVLVEMAGS